MNIKQNKKKKAEVYHSQTFKNQRQQILNAAGK